MGIAFLTVFGLAFISIGQPAKAACGTTLECQIAVILEQIKALQTQLLTLQGQQVVTPTWCYDFYTNFGIGTSNADFGALINVLDRENISEFTSFNRPSLYNEIIAGGVVKLQAKYGILQTGYVGPITRAKLNALYGCSTVVSTQPSVKIMSPNGGETYNSGSSLNITWTTTGIMPLETIDLIRLRSYTTGQEYNLAEVLFNDGQENVVIPSSVPAGSYILEIKTYKNNILVFDVSDSYFKIVNNSTQSSITITSPLGGEQWIQSSTRFITWNSIGIVNAAIDIIGVNGQYRLVSLPGLPAGNGSYNWTVGNTLAGSVMPAGQYRLTIYNADNPATQSFSNYFNIVASTTIGTYPLNISSVTGMKSVYVPGEKISFSVKGLKADGGVASSIEGFNLQAYVCKNGDCNNYLAPNPTNSYNGTHNFYTGLWDVVMNAPSDTASGYTMRVVLYCSQMNSSCWNNYGGYYNGMLNGQVEKLINFSVVSNVQPSIITSPNGGEQWLRGSTQNITWTGGQNPDGSYPGVDIKLLSRACINSGQGTSIEPATGNVTCQTPGAYLAITTGALVSNSYSWQVGKVYQSSNLANVNSNNYFIEVCKAGTNICDRSDNPFSITGSNTTQPSITITSPNGGEVWKYGETRRVTWTSQGVNRVAIYVYNDTVYGSGSTNYLDSGQLSLSVPASQGYFDWNILQSWLPKTTYGNENRYKIRIIDNSSYNGISDTSDGYFSIVGSNIVQPSVTLITPNGGQTYKPGDQLVIKWQVTGATSTSDRIYLAIQNYGGVSGDASIPPIYAPAATDGSSYFYTIPTTLLPNSYYKVSVSGVVNGVAVSDNSDNYFSIAFPDNTFIPWLQAKTLIETCGVKMVMQLHNLNVYLTLLDNTRVTSIEPSIDEVIRVTQNVSYKCGNVPIATE